MADTYNPEPASTDTSGTATGATDSSNIVITGFMGTGKTTVGRLLADRLGFEFVDTDAVIEQRHGPIPEIFQQLGEPRFREIEREVAGELAQRSGLVIATGGRMMLDPANLASLGGNGRVFCLVASPDQIIERVTADRSPIDRPLLAVPDPRQRVVELLTERNPEYRRFAQLSTDGRAPENIADDIATLARSGPQRLAVDSPSGRYDYVVGTAILPFVRQLASVDGPMVVITEAQTAELYLSSLPSPDLVVELPPPESEGAGRHKTLAVVAGVYNRLIEAGVDRSATIVSLGDSVVGDIAAFVAATYLRGLDLVHCPTDLIAMIATSVGGKVGLDLDQGRNLIGLFKQPRAVVADVATLQTLSARQFAAGMAEVVRYGLVADSSLLTYVEDVNWRNDDARTARLGDLQALVAQAAQVKIAMVQEDPSDEDRRQTFNLGHTFARAFAHAEPELLIHGEAVALGLIAASRLSAALGHCPAELADRIEELIERLGLGTSLPRPAAVDLLFEAIDRDKERMPGRRRLVLLGDLGQTFVTDQVPDTMLLDVLASLQPLKGGQ